MLNLLAFKKKAAARLASHPCNSLRPIQLCGIFAKRVSNSKQFFAKANRPGAIHAPKCELLATKKGGE
jgi:hypothetical protein